MSIRPTSFGVGETWTWNIRLRNVANAAVDADSTPTVTVYKNNSATGESVTVTKPSATTGWYQCSFDPAGEAEHDVYSFVENVTIASVAQAPFQWEAVVLASVGAGGLDAAGVRAAVGLASANMDTQLSGINNKTTNLPSDPADQSAVDGLIVAAVAAIRGADDDTLKTLSDQIDGIDGGGGGDATLAKQTEILAAIQGSAVIQVASPNVQGNLVLTQGDDYDGTANPKASWTVTTDYTDGWSVTLTVRDTDDAVVYTTAGEVVSATVVAVTIAAPTGLTMTGCPGQWQGKFDVQMTKAGKKKTIALGVCYINEDQTR